MFIDPPQPALRQGDLAIVEAMPTWHVGNTGITRSGNQQIVAMQLPLAKTVPLDSDGRLVMVCSHSCDIENPRNRSGLLVAPIIKVPAGEQKEKDRWTRIVSSHSPNDDNAFEYTHLFPVELPAALGGSWAVVDFSSIISMGKAADAAEVLTANKAAELSDEYREKLQLKLAVFVGAPDRAAGT